jgi:hypothetical protein
MYSLLVAVAAVPSTSVVAVVEVALPSAAST